MNVNELWDEKNESKEKTATMLASIGKEEPEEEQEDEQDEAQDEFEKFEEEMIVEDEGELEEMSNHIFLHGRLDYREDIITYEDNRKNKIFTRKFEKRKLFEKKKKLEKLRKKKDEN